MSDDLAKAREVADYWCDEYWKADREHAATVSRMQGEIDAAVSLLNRVWLCGLDQGGVAYSRQAMLADKLNGDIDKFLTARKST